MWITLPLTSLLFYERIEFSMVTEDKVIHMDLLEYNRIIVYDLEFIVKNPSNPLNLGVFTVWKNALLHERKQRDFVVLCRPLKKVISE